jgi:hypothetical protein
LHKPDVFDPHGDIDGIEVHLASETPTQIGGGLDGRLKFVATRTQESKKPSLRFTGIESTCSINRSMGILLRS